MEKIKVRVYNDYDYYDVREFRDTLGGDVMVSHCNRKDEMFGDDDLQEFLSLYYTIFKKYPDCFHFDLPKFREYCKETLSEEFGPIYEYAGFRRLSSRAFGFGRDCDDGFGYDDYDDVKNVFLKAFKKYDGKTLRSYDIRGYCQGELCTLFTFDKKNERYIDYISDLFFGYNFYCVSVYKNYEMEECVCGIYMPDLYSGNTNEKNIEIIKKEMPDIFKVYNDYEIVLDLDI